MADLYNYVEDTGVIIPDTSELLADVQTEYQALGNDLSLDPSSPQGILITAETASRSAAVANNAALANQINPNIAGGIFLDAICALTGLNRIAGTNSIIRGVVLSGVASTLISAGVLAQTTDGNIFQSLNAVVLDSSGHATVDFKSVDIGPVPALIGSLNQIITNVLGWENVTNPNVATLGINEQSDQALRALRRNTLALQGAGLAESITSALYAVPNVLTLQFRENYTNATKTIDGVSLLANSIFACVDGGADTDIAAALLANKSGGCNWNGNRTVNVVEPSSGQSYPVKFTRPTELQILAKITVKADATLSDPTTTVKNAVIAYATGQIEGERGFGVGNSVSPFELAGAINNAAPGIYVQNVQITLSTAPTSFAAAEIPVGISQVARIIPSNIQVIIA